MHMDLACTNFGIQEWSGFGENVREVFPGIPEVKNGYAYVNSAPGFGVEFDEEKAKKYPAKDEIIQWTQFRYTDGSLATP